MGSEKERRKKIDWFFRALEIIEAKGNTANIKYLLPAFAYNNGTTERTGSEILKMLESVGDIETSINGEVWLSNKYKKRNKIK